MPFQDRKVNYTILAATSYGRANSVSLLPTVETIHLTGPSGCYRM